jgi:hypothetical protein
MIGATYIKMSERPYTKNQVLDKSLLIIPFLDLTPIFLLKYLLTRLVNKLPNIDTDVPSNLL